jgi:Flp pilus assembly protein TadD
MPTISDAYQIRLEYYGAWADSGIRMQQDAQPHCREVEIEGRQRRRPLVLAPIAITLALGACSSLTPREEAAGRPPSLRVAKAALDSGAPDLALRVADLELAKKPNDASALVARGDALYALGRPDQAQIAYRAAIKIQPDASAAQVGLGRTLAQSDPSAAEAAFLSALSREPDNAVALNNLGVVLDLQGRHTDAQAAYSHAISVAPTSADVQINLGMSLVLSGRTAEASRLLRGIASDPEVRQAWRKELVNALTLAGDSEWARQELPTDALQPVQSKMAVAEQAGSALKEASSSVAALDKRLQNSSAGAPPGSKGTDNELGSVPVPPELRQTPPIAADPLQPVIASDLPPVVSKGREKSSGKPVGSSPELAERSETQEPAVKPLDAIAGPPDPLDRFAVAAVPESEGVSTSDTEPVVDDFYVQLASLTSEAGAFSEWDRLKRWLPQFLGNRDPTVTRAEAHGRMYWRLRTFGFASSLEAKQMCRELERTSLHCWTGRGV